MSLTVLSFLAGILTVLAPCVFSLLPIILGKSAASQGKWRPYVITASLAISLAAFTLLLKISTLFLDVPPSFWTYVSGLLIITLGLISIFPGIWENITTKLGLSKGSDKLLDKAKKQPGLLGDILTGASLGPVFSSCSPTYAFVLSTTLQGSLNDGLINIGAYILGLSLIMLAVGLLGQRLVKRMRWMANPNGWFKKIVGVLFLIVGLLIITGYDKQLNVAYVAIDPFKTVELENKLIKDNLGGDSRVGPARDEGFNIPSPYEAAEITGINDWINSNPQTITGLKGKVVLVDFWTYSCINCQRTIPYLNQWYDAYKDQGFTILGLHAPEFAFEKKKENVEKAVQGFDIKYPVGLDNDFATWKAYKNKAWPSKYLIDADGKVRYFHFGEGDYEVTERLIRSLIEQNNGKTLDSKIVGDAIKVADGAVANQTPETYLGWSRIDSKTFANYSELAEEQAFGVSKDYTSKPLISNGLGLTGQWVINNENVVSQTDTSKLKLKFNAKNVYLVAGSAIPSTVTIEFNKDGKVVDSSKIKGEDIDVNNQFVIGEDKLYKLVQADNFLDDTELELTVPKGVRLNVFTFGG